MMSLGPSLPLAPCSHPRAGINILPPVAEIGKSKEFEIRVHGSRRAKS
jgi:hypothetical protein